MTLPCPHLDQLERSEDHVNSWHRPRRQQLFREFLRIWTEAQALRDGRYLRHSRKTTHRRTHTFGAPISRITYARRRRGPRTRLEYHPPGLPLPPPVEDTALGTASRPATLKITGRAAEDQKKEC